MSRNRQEVVTDFALTTREFGILPEDAVIIQVVNQFITETSLPYTVDPPKLSKQIEHYLSDLTPADFEKNAQKLSDFSNQLRAWSLELKGQSPGTRAELINIARIIDLVLKVYVRLTRPELVRMIQESFAKLDQAELTSKSSAAD